MTQRTRRDFLKVSAGSAGILVAAPALLDAVDTGRPTGYAGNDVVPLGRTGIRVSRLAQGTGFHGGRRSSDHTRMGQEAFERLVQHSVDQGVTFMDMADSYGSHPYVAQALRDVPRDKVVLSSKIWARPADWITPSGGAKREVDRFRQELKTERLDVCLIHLMTDAQWPTEFERVRDELSELKDKGDVGAVGVSCHDFGALEVASAHPWVDVIFARINYKGGSENRCDGTADEVAAVLKTARRNGKAVVGMKIFGGGSLVTPEERDASLQFVLGNDLVDATTIGMKSPTEVDDTLARMARVRAA